MRRLVVACLLLSAPALAQSIPTASPDYQSLLNQCRYLRDEANNRLEGLGTALDKAKIEIAAKDAEVKKIKDEIAAKDAEINKSKEKLAKLNAEIAKMDAELADLKKLKEPADGTSPHP